MDISGKAKSRLGVSLIAIAACGPSSAEPQAIEETPVRQNVQAAQLPDLEIAFWRCDYRATVHGVDATPVDLCSEVTEQLKQRKFGGDFERMLQWWRLNKPAEHSRMADRR